ncbi:unnamed protein product [Phaeothamnion confervicola]
MCFTKVLPLAVAVAAFSSVLSSLTNAEIRTSPLCYAIAGRHCRSLRRHSPPPPYSSPPTPQPSSRFCLRCWNLPCPLAAGPSPAPSLHCFPLLPTSLLLSAPAIAPPVRSKQGANMAVAKKSDSIETCVRKMLTADVRHLPVVEDATGEVFGLISVKDLVKEYTKEKDDMISKLFGGSLN